MYEIKNPSCFFEIEWRSDETEESSIGGRTVAAPAERASRTRCDQKKGVKKNLLCEIKDRHRLCVSTRKRRRSNVKLKSSFGAYVRACACIPSSADKPVSGIPDKGREGGGGGARWWTVGDGV